MKKLATILSLSILSSCTLFNVHNVNNKYKWKNKAFEEPLFAKVIFEPEFKEKYGDDAKFFYDYFEDTTKVEQLKYVFIQKLAERNIIAATDGYEAIIRLETIYLTEKTEWVDVETTVDGETVHLGEAVEYDVDIKLQGRVLNLKNNKTSNIEESHKFSSRPRPGVIMKTSIAHSNSLINMHTLFTNMLNKLSVEAYNEIRQ